MGGGDGVIITRDSMVNTLSKPEVHGRLPATITGSLDPILKKDTVTWTKEEVDLVADAARWSMHKR